MTVFLFVGQKDVLINPEQIICVRKSGDGVVVQMVGDIEFNLPEVGMERFAEELERARKLQ